MSKMKKTLSLVLVLVLCCALSVGLTVAYLTDRDSEANVFTVGDVSIDLTENFQQGSALIPGEKIEKAPEIRNTGSNDAWVWMTVAVPAELDTVIHKEWMEQHVGEGKEWDNSLAVVDTVIDNENFKLYTLLYNTALTPNEITSPSLREVYLDSKVDIDPEGQWNMIENGNASELQWNTADGAPVIYVSAYAIQAEGFDTVQAAYAAYNTQWGSNGTEYAEPAAVVYTVEELTTALTEAADAGSGDTAIVLGSDLDMSNVDWQPIKVDGYHGAGVVTLDGGNHTITGLDAPLFEGGFAGKSGIVIKNLTIADSEIESDSDLGAGAFIANPDSMHVITLENCHLINSTVDAPAARSGGLLGWASGYANLNDGPVKAYITIRDCSVIDSTVTGTAVGGVAGHPGASDYTWTTIENCTVLNNTLTSTDDGNWRVGAIVGTANNGHIVISNCTIGGNVLSQPNGEGKVEQAGTTYPGEEVGRFVPGTTGTLVINGTAAAVATTEGLNETLANGGNVVLSENIQNEDSTKYYGDASKLIDMTNGGVLDGAGNTIAANDEWDHTYDTVIYTTGGTIKNVTIDGAMRGIFSWGLEEDLILDNVIFNDVIYTVNDDASNGYAIKVSNSVLNGWTSWTTGHSEVSFTDCQFGEGMGYAFINAHQSVTFTNCAFEEGFEINPANTNTYLTFDNCTYNGVAITEDNVADVLYSADDAYLCIVK